MRRFYRYIGTVLLSLFAAGCIENDIPYPVVKAEIKAFSVQGQTGAAVINSTDLTVTVDLADTVDLNKVTLLQFEVTDGATVVPEPAKLIDLSQPMLYTLSIYQDYLWSVKATQTIERELTVENQIGSPIFDEQSKIVLVTVSLNTDLTNLKVLSMKLGPTGSEIIPDYTTVTDFSKSQKFVWVYKDRSEAWIVKVVKSGESVSTGSVDAYAKSAFVNGTFTAGSGSPTFAYKKKSEDQWQIFAGDVSVSGGSFSANITSLEPLTEYVVKSKVGEVYGNEVSFTTESALQVENSSFDSWIKEGKSWFPNIDLTDEHYIWDSGNKGANTLSEKNPTTAEESNVISGKAAKMASTAILGVFAAGSIYTGKYVQTVGLGGKLDFGIPFASRPTGIKGYYCYTPGVIDKSDDTHSYLIGKNDTCHIYAALADWSAPFVINTSEKKFLDPVTESSVIAYCSLTDGTGTNSGYKEFNMNFTYKDRTRKPTYILIVASASKYGDYFTGSTNSILYVDEFELTYE